MCWRQLVLGRGLRRHGLRFGPLAFRAARFGRFLRNRGGLEAHHADALLLEIGLFIRAKDEQHEQQERRYQDGQAYGKRAAPHPDAELLDVGSGWNRVQRSEEHTSELQSLMRISYAV